MSDTAGLYRVSVSTIRSWRRRSAEWLPQPIATLNGGAVWLRAEVERQAAAYHFGTTAATGASASARKRALGSYYTSEDTAHFLAEWLLKRGAKKILEPSFGDGVFVAAIRDQAKRANLEHREWVAAEIDEDAIGRARRGNDLLESEIRHGDFLSLAPEPVDAVIANPPYVRLRNLDEKSRRRAQSVYQQTTGMALSPASSLWLPFLIHSVSFLCAGGSLAMVLPSDFSYVAYARSSWIWVAAQFSDVRVIRVRKRLFPDINQDVILLLCEGKGGATEVVHFEAFEDVQDLVADKAEVSAQIPVARLAGGERVFQQAIGGMQVWKMLHEEFPSLLSRSDEYMQFRIGYVAGDKKYFHPDSETVKRYSLPETSLIQSITGARRLKGHGLNTSVLPDTATENLWLPSEQLLSGGEVNYIEHGVRTGVSSGYKARQREPWFRVPTVRVPDVVVTVFSESPLLLVNDAKLQASNSLICGYSKGIQANDFALRWYSPITQLSVATEVHSLGGGVLVLVPNEANAVQIPSIVRPNSDLQRISAALSAGDVDAAYRSGRGVLASLIGENNASLIDESVDRLRRWRIRARVAYGTRSASRASGFYTLRAKARMKPPFAFFSIMT